MGNLTAKMPQNVKTSLILFGISIVLGIISHQFLSKSLDAYVAEIQQQYAQGVPQNSAATEGGKIGGYIGFLLNIFLLYMVYKGKKLGKNSYFGIRCFGNICYYFFCIAYFDANR